MTTTKLKTDLRTLAWLHWRTSINRYRSLSFLDKGVTWFFSSFLFLELLLFIAQIPGYGYLYSAAHATANNFVPDSGPARFWTCTLVFGLMLIGFGTKSLRFTRADSEMTLPSPLSSNAILIRQLFLNKVKLGIPHFYFFGWLLITFAGTIAVTPESSAGIIWKSAISASLTVALLLGAVVPWSYQTYIKLIEPRPSIYILRFKILLQLVAALLTLCGLTPLLFSFYQAVPAYLIYLFFPATLVDMCFQGLLTSNMLVPVSLLLFDIISISLLVMKLKRPLAWNADRFTYWTSIMPEFSTATPNTELQREKMQIAMSRMSLQPVRVTPALQQVRSSRMEGAGSIWWYGQLLFFRQPLRRRVKFILFALVSFSVLARFISSNQTDPLNGFFLYTYALIWCTSALNDSTFSLASRHDFLRCTPLYGKDMVKFVISPSGYLSLAALLVVSFVGLMFARFPLRLSVEFSLLVTVFRIMLMANNECSRVQSGTKSQYWMLTVRLVVIGLASLAGYLIYVYFLNTYHLSGVGVIIDVLLGLGVAWLFLYCAGRDYDLVKDLKDRPTDS